MLETHPFCEGTTSLRRALSLFFFFLGGMGHVPQIGCFGQNRSYNLKLSRAGLLSCQRRHYSLKTFTSKMNTANLPSRLHEFYPVDIPPFGLPVEGEEDYDSLDAVSDRIIKKLSLVRVDFRARF